MAIVCENCLTTKVKNDGEICPECQKEINETKIDRSYEDSVYLPPDLFLKFKKLKKDVENERPSSKKAIGKFLNNLRTSFLDKSSGKEINDPTPKVIHSSQRTVDRIKQILDHQLAVYADKNGHDTPEDLEDWTVADQYSDDWEQTLYQHVESVRILEEDDPKPNITPAPDPGENDPTPGGSEPPAES